MVIDSNSGINPANAGNTRGRTDGAAAGKAGATPGRAAPADSGAAREDVVLSQEAQALTRLEARIQASADVDTEKVAAIREAIAGGRFEIDAESIADRLLQQDDLLG